MGEFFKKHSYTIVKLFVTQFAIALFGIGLWCAAMMMKNDTVKIVASVGAIAFYLFLLYAHVWEIGAKEGITAEARHQPRKLMTGFYMGLTANSLNLVLALMMLPEYFFAGYRQVSGMAKTVSMFLHGMYTGLITTLNIGTTPLNQLAWVYFVITVPAILVTGLAYIFGSYNWHLTNILIPKNTDVKNNGRPE